MAVFVLDRLLFSAGHRDGTAREVRCQLIRADARLGTGDECVAAYRRSRRHLSGTRNWRRHAQPEELSILASRHPDSDNSMGGSHHQRQFHLMGLPAGQCFVLYRLRAACRRRRPGYASHLFRYDLLLAAARAAGWHAHGRRSLPAIRPHHDLARLRQFCSERRFLRRTGIALSPHKTNSRTRRYFAARMAQFTSWARSAPSLVQDFHKAEEEGPVSRQSSPAAAAW